MAAWQLSTYQHLALAIKKRQRKQAWQRSGESEENWRRQSGGVIGAGGAMAASSTYQYGARHRENVAAKKIANHLSAAEEAKKKKWLKASIYEESGSVSIWRNESLAKISA